MRISDWSSDVCSSDLDDPPYACGTGRIVLVSERAAARHLDFAWCERIRSGGECPRPHSCHSAPPARPAPRAAPPRADRPALSRGRAAPAYPDDATARRGPLAAPPLAAVDRVGGDRKGVG